MREHTPQLLGVARAFARGEDEAEDLLQELWIMVNDQLHVRAEAIPTKALLHTTLLNIGRSRWRRAKRRQRLMAFWKTEFPVTIAPPAYGDVSVQQHIWRKIAELPTLQRNVVLYRLIEDRSTAETARLLGRAEGSVKASLHAALAALRSQLRGERDD